MKKVCVAALGLVLLAGQPVFAVDLEPCRKACEDAEVVCRNQANQLPNEVDMQDAIRACDEEITNCSNGCTPEMEQAQREEQEKAEREKAAQEKAARDRELQQQQINEQNHSVPLSDLNK